MLGERPIDQDIFAGRSQGRQQPLLLELEVGLQLVGEARLHLRPGGAALGRLGRFQRACPFGQHQAGVVIAGEAHEVRIALHLRPHSVAFGENAESR